MKKSTVAAILSLAWVLGSSAWSQAEGNLAVAAASLFDTYCLSKAGTFEDLAQRATDAHYEVVIDRSIPMPNGALMRQKNWLVPPGSGPGAPIMLTSNDVTNGSLHVFGCGIYGPELDGKAMESALSNLSRLGVAVKHAQVPGGSSVITWLARVGERAPSVDTQVLLSHDTPGMPGVSVILILKNHLESPAAIGHGPG